MLFYEDRMQVRHQRRIAHYTAVPAGVAPFFWASRKDNTHDYSG